MIPSPPLYTADELNDRDKRDLEIIAEARGIEVKGSGADGNVLVDDLVSAILKAQDAAGLNPAVEAEPFVQPRKRYRVTASTAVFERDPGTEFHATIPPDRELILIGSGALSVVPPNPALKPAPESKPKTSKPEEKN